MSRIRIVTMRFDLTNEYDAATYRGLAESGRRAFRSNRGMQANYLVGLLLGARPYTGLQDAGLTELPQLLPEIDERLSDLQARVKKAERYIASRPLRKQSRAPILRLIPNKDHNSSQESA